jgi:hypothetical protein
MRASLFIGLLGALALAIGSPAEAKGGKGGGHAFGKGGHPPAFAQATRQPPGWSRGRKTGWRCTVGTRGCVPPGLR